VKHIAAYLPGRASAVDSHCGCSMPTNALLASARCWARESDPESVLRTTRLLAYRIGGAARTVGASDGPSARSAEQFYRGESISLRLPAEGCTGSLLNVARENHVSLFMVLQAGVSGLLSALELGTISRGSTIAAVPMQLSKIWLAFSSTRWCCVRERKAILVARTVGSVCAR